LLFISNCTATFYWNSFGFYSLLIFFMLSQIPCGVYAISFFCSTIKTAIQIYEKLKARRDERRQFFHLRHSFKNWSCSEVAPRVVACLGQRFLSTSLSLSLPLPLSLTLHLTLSLSLSVCLSVCVCEYLRLLVSLSLSACIRVCVWERLVCCRCLRVLARQQPHEPHTHTHTHTHSLTYRRTNVPLAIIIIIKRKAYLYNAYSQIQIQIQIHLQLQPQIHFSKLSKSI